MKEDGMKKLIELLNEYEKELGIGLYVWRIEGEDIIGENLIMGGDEAIDVGYLVICSKWYEFIKWLIDNDKINLNNSNLLDLSTELGCAVSSDIVIMALSISDNPIEDLIKYLK